MNAPTPPDETRRLAALEAYAVLDTALEADFDDITELAARALEMPISLVSFVDAQRQWFKSAFGLEVRQTPRPLSFCAHAILTPGERFEVEDAHADPRFRDNALVTGPPHIRFYAAVPLLSPQGLAIGTLNVIDRRPRRLDERQWKVLRVLARQVQAQLDLRLQTRRLEERARGQSESEATLRQGYEALLERLRLASAAKSESEARFRGLWESAQDTVLILDEHSIIEYTNESVTRTFGWTPEELIGQDVAVLQPERLRSAHTHGMNRYLHTGERRVNWRSTETTALHRSGREIAVEVSFSDFTVQGRRRFAGFLRDIDGRKQADAERSRLQTRLRQVQRLESLGTFAGGIAHDFNNIVGSMLGNVALARDDLAPDHPALRSLQQIEQAALRGRALVAQILAFSRQQPPALSPQDLTPTVQATARLLHSLLPAGVTLTLRVPEAPVCARVDTVQLERVLMNLGTNAIHACTPQGGHIEIGLSTQAGALDAAGDEPAGGEKTGAEHARLWVADTGAGMDNAVRERLFEPFFTTKPVGQGTGLGLSVVHGIVHSHGGQIQVTSRPGGGARFEVLLPTLDCAAPAPAPAPAPASAPAADAVPGPRAQAAPMASSDPGNNTPVGPAPQPLSVLCIDDDEVMLLMVERLLARSGCTVTTAQDPQQALQRLLQGGLVVDCVVTDYSMPALTGLELARRLHERLPGLPVVLMTGDGSEALRSAASALDIGELVPKQEAVERLAPAVRRAVRRGASPPPAAGAS